MLIFCVCVCVSVFGGLKKSVRSSRAFHKLLDTRFPKKFPLISQNVAQKMLKVAFCNEYNVAKRPFCCRSLPLFDPMQK